MTRVESDVCPDAHPRADQFDPTVSSVADHGVFQDFETQHLDQGYDNSIVRGRYADLGVDVLLAALAGGMRQPLVLELRATPPDHQPVQRTPARSERPRRRRDQLPKCLTPPPSALACTETSGTTGMGEGGLRMMGRKWSTGLLVPLAVVMMFGVAGCAAAGAGTSSSVTRITWPRATSSYNNIVRVSTNGYHERTDAGPRALLNIFDESNDGNTVYAYATFTQLRSICTNGGVNVWIVSAGSSTCDLTEDSIHAEAYTSAEISNTSATWAHTKNWCDQNGGNCWFGSIKVQSGACAQMGFPIPDSCTFANVSISKGF